MFLQGAVKVHTQNATSDSMDNKHKHPMKQTKSLAGGLIFLALIMAALGWSGCASTKEHNTESLLSAAGFRTLTPGTPQQKSVYASMPPYKVQRHNFNGRVVYAYADQKAGVVYVGDEGDYQRYRQLAQQQKISNEQVEAAEMNQDAAMNWGAWGP